MELNLKNDIVFKAFFSRKGNEKFLREFLESVIKIKINKIIIKEEVNLEKLFKQEKGGKLDLLATLNGNTNVNIEMQLRKTPDFLWRVPKYTSKIMARDIGNGLKYDEINKVISINILDYVLFEEYDDYLNETVTVLDKHRECEVIESPKYYFIELPKFRKIKPDLNNKLEQWLLFIDDYDKGGIEMVEKKNKTLKEAQGVMNYLTGDEEIKRLTELRERWDFDYNWDMRAEREAGIKSGKKQKTLEIAREMLKNGADVDFVAKCTKLSKEEILKLKNNIPILLS